MTLWQLRETICHFSHKSVATITREQNTICSKTHLDGTTHKQTIICKQLFAGQVMCSRPMRNKEKASNEKYDLLFSFSFLQRKNNK